MFRKLVMKLCLTVIVSVGASTLGFAQNETYPSRPVTVITGFGAGGGPEVILRVVAERLSRSWNQQVVVLNRPGANNSIAMQAAAQANPDGYTLLMAPSGLYYTVPETQPNLTVSAARDFTPIGMIGDQPMLIAVSPKLGVKSLAELVALAKEKPGTLAYGAGRGSLPHITGVRFQRQTGINLTFVPYPATAGAINDTVTGTLPVIVESQSALAGVVESGTLLALGVASQQRLGSLPKLPTIQEQLPALGEFEATGWFALVAPAGTPAVVLDKVGASLREALADPALLERFAALGTRARPMSPDQVRQIIARDQELLRPLVKSLNLAQ